MTDIGNMIDSSFLTKALDIANKQTTSLGSIVVLIFSARILFAFAFTNNIDSYLDSFKHFLLCSVLLFCLGDIVNLFYSIPEIVTGESKNILKVAVSNEEVIEGYNYFMNLVLIATYWICIVFYYLAMFFLICIGPILVVLSFLTGSFGVLKLYFTFLMIINIWPLGWHLVNIFVASLVNSFEVLQNGFMSGVILLFSSVIKLAIPVFLYILNKPLGFLMLNTVRKGLEMGASSKASRRVRQFSNIGMNSLDKGITTYQRVNDGLYATRLRSTPFSSQYLAENDRKNSEENQQQMQMQREVKKREAQYLRMKSDEAPIYYMHSKPRRYPKSFVQQTVSTIAKTEFSGKKMEHEPPVYSMIPKRKSKDFTQLSYSLVSKRSDRRND